MCFAAPICQIQSHFSCFPLFFSTIFFIIIFFFSIYFLLSFYSARPRIQQLISRSIEAKDTFAKYVHFEWSEQRIFEINTKLCYVSFALKRLVIIPLAWRWVRVARRQGHLPRQSILRRIFHSFLLCCRYINFVMLMRAKRCRNFTLWEEEKFEVFFCSSSSVDVLEGADEVEWDVEDSHEHIKSHQQSTR